MLRAGQAPRHENSDVKLAGFRPKFAPPLREGYASRQNWLQLPDPLRLGGGSAEANRPTVRLQLQLDADLEGGFTSDVFLGNA